MPPVLALTSASAFCVVLAAGVAEVVVEGEASARQTMPMRRGRCTREGLAMWRGPVRVGVCMAGSMVINRGIVWQQGVSKWVTTTGRKAELRSRAATQSV